jgi:hypothetical protein
MKADRKGASQRLASSGHRRCFSKDPMALRKTAVTVSIPIQGAAPQQKFRILQRREGLWPRESEVATERATQRCTCTRSRWRLVAIEHLALLGH